MTPARAFESAAGFFSPAAAHTSFKGMDQMDAKSFGHPQFGLWP
jgi:hypothetical protein